MSLSMGEEFDRYVRCVEVLTGGQYKAPAEWALVGTDAQIREVVNEMATLVVVIITFISQGRCWDCGVNKNRHGIYVHRAHCRAIDMDDTLLDIPVREVI